jgi:toxin ParE1/3/4
MRLSISRRAQADLDEIWTFVATESGSFEIADRVLSSLARTLDVLRRSPYAGKSREQDLRSNLRSIASGKYLIFHRVDAGIVCIVRVIHGSRDVQAIFSDD